MFAIRMAYRQLFPLLALLILSATAMLTGPGCANIIPPAGGPRDSLPPVLVKVTPLDSTRNFTGSRIVFSFNEFIELQAPQENLLMSPLPKNYPVIDYRLNTVTVRLKDTLESNTTYSLNFGSAIKDYNEGNVLKGFTYTFTTGNYFDSLTLGGNVVLAETGKVDTTLIVMLHTSPDDSAVIRERPRYIAKLDSRGNFLFSNLPPKTFYLYALKDEGGTRRYFSDKQLFAFAGKPVITGAKNENITLYAYSARPATVIPPLSLNRGKAGGNAADKRLKYTTSLVANQQDLLSNFMLTFEQPLKAFDSTRLRLYTDSAYNDPGIYHFRLDSSRKVITLVHEWKENRDYRLILDKDFGEDSTGKKLLKTDTLSFRTKKLADYGSLKLRFRNLELSKNPVLQILTGETIYKSFPLAGAELSQPLFLPGEYELRILFDDNRNGKWDPGEFFGKHKQPEIVKPVERKLSVKANFQNEVEIVL